ncbi:MAG: U32 family peptidase [Clostridia bacterium]|nr:U32 family peptidase [Clostridia bacterium]
MRRCEILSPAGNLEKLKFAVVYGADAVYLALNRFGMRASADNFTVEELKEGLEFAHAHGTRVYCTLNTMPRDHELNALDELLDSIADCLPDAFIVSDPGVIATVRARFPQAELHLSTQCSTVNSRACRFWYEQMGIKRIVLARELTIKEIKAIRASIPEEMEIECFVHGAMCISYSGRCLLSNYITGRDANRGMCAQPCRWEYTLSDMRDGIPFAAVKEDEGGTYAFSSKDLCMVEHIKELAEAGVDSFKIEGRMKSAYYTAAVTNAYRMAYDSYLRDPEGYTVDPMWKAETESVSHREYDTGFFFTPPYQSAKVCSANVYLNDRAYLATVSDYDEATGLAKCIQRNKFCTGDRVQILSPGTGGRDAVIEKIFNEDMEEIESVPHPKQVFYLPLKGAKKWDIIRCGE